MEQRHSSLSKQDHHPAWPQNVQAFQKRGLAHRIVNHVDTFAVRQALGFTFKILLRIKDDFIRAGLPRQFGFSSVETVPITRAPILCAICTSSSPTPPAAACTRAVSPRFSGNVV